MRSIARLAMMLLIGLALTALASAPLALAQERSERGGGRRPSLEAVAPNPPASSPLSEEKPVTARRKITLAGRELAYTATAGSLLIRGAEEREGGSDTPKARARIFYVAYALDEARAAERPILFAFNGGPGSSSIWLHAGFMAPKRAQLTDDGRSPLPPGGLAVNEDTLLPYADLVFIDPPGTGYSRIGPNEKPEQFYGFRNDVKVMAEFIRVYLSRHGRWASPRLIAGESYGGMRAAGLADELERDGVALSGVALISVVLNYQTISANPGNDLPFPLFLPSYAATAWYHKRLAPELQGKSLSALVEEVAGFARSSYQSALFLGNRTPAAERAEVRRRLADYTGLAETLIEEADLRPRPGTFFRELLKAQQLVIGRFDGRLTGRSPDGAQSAGHDPTVAHLLGPYRTGLDLILRGEIGYKSDLEYRTSSGEARGKWDFGAQNSYLNAAPQLAHALAYNPALKVFVAQGYFDLATPFGSVDHVLDHLPDAGGKLAARISVRRYLGGHMMYSVASERKALARDLGAFIEAVTARPANGQ